MDQDQHGEKEAENKSQDSAGQREESVDQRAGYKAEEEEESAPAAAAAGLLIKEVVVASGEEEESSSPTALLAHPCSLLQLLLRACAGCLGLHGGYCSSDDPKPDAPAADSASQEGVGEGGGDKANNYFYMQAEVFARVRAVRRPPPPPGRRPREGSGGNGGAHH